MAVLSEFSTNKLKSFASLRGGFATSESFQVSFTAKILPLSKIGIKPEITYLCENVALPTKSISGADKLIYGLNYQMPYRHTYPEIAMTFYCTKNMDEKKAFDKWQNLIINPKTGDLSYYDDYTCDITIKKFHRDAIDFSSTPVYTIKLEKAWPSIVAEVQLTHSAGSEITRLPVTFQYKKWRQVI